MNTTIPGVRDLLFMVIGMLVGASLLMTAALMAAAGRETAHQ